MSSVRVMCRVRPQNNSEKARADAVCTDVASKQEIKVSEHSFVFDHVFDMQSTQNELYDEVGKPVVKDVLKGYNATIFAYGQTSSGKTFTMQGPDIMDGSQKGIIPRVIEEIFREASSAPTGTDFIIKASYLEIYMERIRDLLNNQKTNLKIREEKARGIYVEDATELFVSSVEEVFQLIDLGTANRAIAETKMNALSSRSHSVFVLYIQQKMPQKTINSKLYLVDLAGSEKVGKTGAAGTTLDEAKKINLSLSALGNVINALTDGKSKHIPYRDSKLTRMLQESLGGNATTTLVVCCSPSSYNLEETISTLRFGIRAKTIKNKAKLNVEQSAAELKLLLEKAHMEIERLKHELRKAKGLTGPDDENGSVFDLEYQPQEVKQMQERIEELEENAEIIEKEKEKLTEISSELEENLFQSFRLIESLCNIGESLERQRNEALMKTNYLFDELEKNEKIIASLPKQMERRRKNAFSNSIARAEKEEEDTATPKTPIAEKKSSSDPLKDKLIEEVDSRKLIWKETEEKLRKAIENDMQFVNKLISDEKPQKIEPENVISNKTENVRTISEVKTIRTMVDVALDTEGLVVEKKDENQALIENKELTTIIKKHEEEIKTLKQKNSLYDATLLEKNNEIANMKKEFSLVIDKMKEHYAEAQATYSNDLMLICEKNIHLETKLDETKTKNLSDTASKMKKDIQAKSKQITKLTSDVEKLTELNKALSNDNKRRDMDYQFLQVQVENYRNAAQKKELFFQRVQENFKAERLEHQDYVQKTNAEIIVLKKALSSLQSKITESSNIVKPVKKTEQYR